MKTKLVLSMALVAAFLICLPVVEAMRPSYYFYYAQQQRWKTNPYTHTAGTYTPYWQQNTQSSPGNWQNVQAGQTPMYTLHNDLFNNTLNGTLSGMNVGQLVSEQNGDWRSTGAQVTKSFNRLNSQSSRFTPYVFKGMKDNTGSSTTGMTDAVMKMHGLKPSNPSTGTTAAPAGTETTMTNNPYTGVVASPAGTTNDSSSLPGSTPTYMK